MTSNIEFSLFPLFDTMPLIWMMVIRPEQNLSRAVRAKRNEEKKKAKEQEKFNRR
jgi:hypothetical protein